MYDGAYFQSPEFRSETPGDEKRYRFCIVVGKLTNDPKIENFKTTKVSFNIKYYTKQYLNVVLWGDTDVSYAARSLEKGDTVMCAGTITYTKYIVRSGEHKGEQKEWHDLNCQFLMAQAWANCIIEMFSATGIQKLLSAEESDVMESLDDHYEEYDEGSYADDEEYDEEYDDYDGNYDLGI